MDLTDQNAEEKSTERKDRLSKMECREEESRKTNRMSVTCGTMSSSLTERGEKIILGNNYFSKFLNKILQI